MITPLDTERAKEIAHVFNSTGLTHNEQINIVSAKLSLWREFDKREPISLTDFRQVVEDEKEDECPPDLDDRYPPFRD